MKLAVLLYKYADHAPEGIPGDWPADMRELSDDAELPGPTWLWMTSAELNAQRAAHQAEYNAWESSLRTAASNYAALAGMLQRARTFGDALIIQTAMENIAMGITQAGKTRAVADYTQKLQNYLSSGSLYAAIEELDSMIDDVNRPSLELSPYITTERLNAAKNQIKVYLGIL